MRLLNFTFQIDQDTHMPRLLDSKFCRYKGGSDNQSAGSQSQLDPAQQKMLRAASNVVTPRVGQGATPYGGQMVADMGEGFFDSAQLFFDKIGSTMQASDEILNSFINQDHNYEAKTEDVIKKWEEMFAKPAMQVWQDTVGKDLKQQYNLPGTFNSSRRGDAVARASNQFYGGSVSPQLFSALTNEYNKEFQSAESGRNLAFQANNMRTNMPYQQAQQGMSIASNVQKAEQMPLSAQYQEFMRTAPEADPWLQMALGYGTIPTMDTYIKSQTTDPSPMDYAALGVAFAGI